MAGEILKTVYLDFIYCLFYSSRTAVELRSSILLGIYLPLKTLASLLGGLLLTFIRMQSSIKDAIIVHCLHNLIGILLAIGLGLLFIDEAMTDIKINL